jgi:hypothetical protein
LSQDGILTNGFLFVKRWTLHAGDTDRSIARVNRATRARYWHILTGSFYFFTPLVVIQYTLSKYLARSRDYHGTYHAVY